MSREITDEDLIKEAKEASQGSNSKYSNFSVGAAALIEDSSNHQFVVKGTNYETGNFKSVCAERHVLQTAHLEHALKGESPTCKSIAIYSPNSMTPIVPCGDCRQALYENNPKMKIISVAADGEKKEYSIDELLPHAFNFKSSKKAVKSKVLDELKDYVVHFPIFHNKLKLLKGLDRLILVGSPIRAKALSKYFQQLNLWGGCTSFSYCDIVLGETDREFNLFVNEWKDCGLKVGIVSHGIGGSGVEIVLSELSALIGIANERNDQKSPLKAVIRCGTRGTLIDVKLGSLALTTEAFNQNFDSSLPDPTLCDLLRKASEAHNEVLEEGSTYVADFFWGSQGRTPYPLLHLGKKKDVENEKHLRSLKQKNIRWIEMEDYFVNHFSSLYGIKSACIGLVVAKRYDPSSDKFVLSYCKDTKAERELLPGLIALQALKALNV
jgi:cytidine deaminase